MNDDDRLNLIDQLMQMIETYHATMGSKLPFEEKRILYQSDYDVYSYDQDSILKPVSVYNFMFKAFNEICNGIIQQTHQLPFYNEYERRIGMFMDVLVENNIQPQKAFDRYNPFK